MGDYPYTGKYGKCNYVASKGKVKTKGNIRVSGGTTPMMSAVNTGPISVGISSSSVGFQTYKSGVLSSCGGTINHAVAVVGYETSSSTPYWIVRNSWGAKWGN